MVSHVCDTVLSLGSPHIDNDQKPLNIHHHNQEIKNEFSLSLKYDHAFPSLSLGLSSDTKEKGKTLLCTTSQASNSHSGVSSYSYSSSVKREREVSVERECLKMLINHDDQDEEGSVRKKLRLSKQQSIILEESFKEHTTLNPKQKQELANQLNLRPRQVEVWFQNRRARTKLKQTEAEYELMKTCRDTLNDENRRLKVEIQGLKAMNNSIAPFYLQMQGATLTMCPSCERTGSNNIGAKPQFYNPLTHSSAAFGSEFKFDRAVVKFIK